MNKWEEIEEIQPIVKKMLTNSLKKQRVSHAYLFEGGRGTGKKATALMFAKTIFCDRPIDDINPCNQCIECKRIQSGNHPNVQILAPDGLSLKKEQIISLQQEFSKKGVESGKKVYIVEHADKMTTQAANSLLKFLEEPSAETLAILLTEHVQQILPTTLSRCQVVNFRPLTPENLIVQLQENGASLPIAATVSTLTNNLQEAITIISDDWFAQARNIVIQLIEVINNRPEQSVLIVYDQWTNHFKEREQYSIGLDLLLLWYKDLLYIKVGNEHQVIYRDLQERLSNYALHSSDETIVTNISAILEAKKRLNANVNPQLLMEQLVLKLQEG
jgi:DNA polymerase-3 subunit delta'